MNYYRAGWVQAAAANRRAAGGGGAAAGGRESACPKHPQRVFLWMLKLPDRLLVRSLDTSSRRGSHPSHGNVRLACINEASRRHFGLFKGGIADSSFASTWTREVQVEAWLELIRVSDGFHMQVTSQGFAADLILVNPSKMHRLSYRLRVDGSLLCGGW